jgi:DNA polymerase III sliding clamp (beta) subunit (PCNA family)
MPKTKKKTQFAVPRAALEAWRFACADGDRPNLTAIHFESEKLKRGRRFHAAATDGYRLLHVSWAPKAKEDHLEEPIDIDSKEVKKFLSYVGKSKKGEPPIRFHVREEGLRVDCKRPEYVLDTGLGKSAPVSVSQEYHFPNWRQVIPLIHEDQKLNKFSHKFGVNLEYVNDFCLFLKKCGNPPGVTFYYADKSALGPILIKPGIPISDEPEVSVEYILMPMRT